MIFSSSSQLQYFAPFNPYSFLAKNSFKGCRHSSFDWSAPTILPPRVQIPSTPSMLLSFIVFVLYLLCEKNKNKQKEARFGTFLKKSFFSVLRESNLDESERRSTSHQIHISHLPTYLGYPFCVTWPLDKGPPD